MKRILFILAAIALTYCSSIAAVPDNVVITRLKNSYVLVPDKSGKQIVQIKEDKEIRYKATRNEGTAVAYTHYDDFTTVDRAKVKAKGVKPVYMPARQAGVFYDDAKICMASVPLNEVGKEVEAVFSVTHTRPDMEPVLFLGSIYPVESQEVTFTMPMAFKDRFDIATRNLPDSVLITREASADGKNWTITLSASNLPEIDLPDDAPSARHSLPTVILKGYFADVNDLYAAMHGSTLSSDPNLEEVVDKTREITKSCHTPIDKAKAIYDWVHRNIRYVAIENGELGHTPDAASEVLRKRYGDCKGSANLIKAMLQAAGIDGRLVWIGTSEIPVDWTDMPVMSSGNHMIAAIVNPDGTITYLDGTVGLADYGYYPSSIQGQQTIIEDGDRCIIDRVPVLSPRVSLDSITIDLAIDGDALHGSFAESITGSYKAALLNRLQDIEPHKRDMALQRYVTEGRTAWNPTDVVLTNGNPDNGPAQIKCDITIDRAVKNAAGKTYVTLDLFSELADWTFDTKDRHYPGELPSPRVIEKRINVEIPQQLQVVSLPERTHVDNDWIDADIDFSQQDTGLITATLSFTVKSTLVPLDKMDSYNSDIKRIARSASNAIVLKSK